MAKNAHLTLSERIIIETSLRDAMSFKQIAREVGKDPSTISKEIRGHIKVLEKDTYNPCRHRRECKHFSDICNSCKFQFGKFCRQCSKVKCFTVCPDFEEMVCLKLQKPPYVCNGCKERSGCKLRRHLYDAKFAQNEYEAVRSESRQGFAMAYWTASPLLPQKEQLQRYWGSEKGIFRTVTSCPQCGQEVFI